jgi:sugar phosphate isomerase/epimerase
MAGMRSAIIFVLYLAAVASAAERAWPLHAMDTAIQRPGLTQEQQFDLVKELGYAGIAWHEEAPEKAVANARAMEQRGLKMVAIYCAANVTPEGELTHSPRLKELMTALKPHGPIIWLHVGGKGPAFETLNAATPTVKTLRGLSDHAAANGLKIAVYPHVGEWTAKFADAVALTDAVNHPAFGVSFNLCHALAGGEEAQVPALLEQAKPRLFIVTLNGADSGVTGGKWDRLIRPLDEGTYDNRALLAKLKSIGYGGPVAFQGYGIKSDARAILEPTMAAWKKLASALP